MANPCTCSGSAKHKKACKYIHNVHVTQRPLFYQPAPKPQLTPLLDAKHRAAYAQGICWLKARLWGSRASDGWGVEDAFNWLPTLKSEGRDGYDSPPSHTHTNTHCVLTSNHLPGGQHPISMPKDKTSHPPSHGSLHLFQLPLSPSVTYPRPREKSGVDEWMCPQTRFHWLLNGCITKVAEWHHC